MRVECEVRTTTLAHPEGCCCRVYKGTTSLQTASTSRPPPPTPAFPHPPHSLSHSFPACTKALFVIKPKLAAILHSGQRLLLLVGCLTSQQHASVSQGQIYPDNFTCCHTEIEVADQTFHLTQSQYTDTGPTSPSADPITPGAWQGSHWSANV